MVFKVLLDSNLNLCSDLYALLQCPGKSDTIAPEKKEEIIPIKGIVVVKKEEPHEVAR